MAIASGTLPPQRYIEWKTSGVPYPACKQPWIFYSGLIKRYIQIVVPRKKTTMAHSTNHQHAQHGKNIKKEAYFLFLRAAFVYLPYAWKQP